MRLSPGAGSKSTCRRRASAQWSQRTRHADQGSRVVLQQVPQHDRHHRTHGPRCGGRGRVLRLQEDLHRGSAHAPRLLGARGRRHALPRRGRRTAGPHAGQAPARATGAQLLPPGLGEGDPQRLPHHRGDEPRSARRHGGRHLPRRPVLPARRHPNRSAAAARTAGRHPLADRAHAAADRYRAGPARGACRKRSCAT